MIRVRPSGERGTFKLPWLDSRHTFSFNRYYDPQHMQFASMRVLNEDWVEPRQGFGMHPHDNMEILTWVMKGRVAHRDTTGGEGVIGPGEMQHMTAGTGILHSEFNASDSEVAHLFQIWLLPEKQGLTPGYEQKKFAPEERVNRLQRVASHQERDGALKIHQDVEVFALDLQEGNSVPYELSKGRSAWIQLAQGTITVNGVRLETGDGVAMEDESSIQISGVEDAHLLLFDMA